MITDITARKWAEEALRKAHHELEGKVQERTKELGATNEALRREIGERMQVEAALRESEERYSLAVRGTNDGLWDWNIKTSEDYLSARWKSMLGYEDYELRNHYDEWANRIHPQDSDRVASCLKAYLEGHAPTFDLEHRLLHKDGTYRWFRSRGICLRDESGRPYRMAGCITDITERKQAEEALRESEERFRTIFESAPIGITIVNRSGGFLYTNATLRALFGYTEHELKGMSFIDVTYPDDIGKSRLQFEELVEGKREVLDLEKRYRCDLTGSFCTT